MKKILMGLLTVASFMSTILCLHVSTEASQGIYIGKELSENGVSIISGSKSYNPGFLSYVQIVEEEKEHTKNPTNEENYDDPLIKSAYKYMIFSGSDCEDDKNYAASMNEWGLTCSINEGLEMESLAEDGYTGQDIARFVGAECKTARNAVTLISEKIDENGASFAGSIVVADQYETWYMEILSVKQYVAVPLAEDKIAIFGDSFVLDQKELESYDRYICSEAIDSLEEENSYSLQYDLSTEVSLDDIFDSYRDYKNENTILNDTLGEIGIASPVSSVYVFEIRKELPAEMADIMWLCPSNPEHAQFVPVSNALSFVAEEYATNIDDSSFVKNNAACEYARLDKVCEQIEEDSNSKIKAYFEDIEANLQMALNEAINSNWIDAYENNDNSYYAFLDEICNSAMVDAVKGAIKLSDDTTWGLVKGDLNYEDLFASDFDIMAYADENGWEASIDEDNIFTASRGDRLITIDLNEATEEDVAEILEIEEVDEAEYGSSLDIVKRDGIDLKSLDKESIESYIQEEIKKVPSSGWTEKEALKELNRIRKNIRLIIENIYGKSIEEISFEDIGALMDPKTIEKLGQNIDPEVMKKLLVELEEGSTGLLEDYFDISFEELAKEAADSGITKDRVQEILEGLEEDVEGLVGAYILDVLDGFVDEDMTPQDAIELLKEASKSAIEVYEDFTGEEVDFEGFSLGIDEISVDDVADVIEALDPKTKNELGNLLGLDVDKAIADYRKGDMEVEINVDIDTDELGIDPEIVKEIEEYLLGEEAIEEVEEIEEETIEETEEETIEKLDEVEETEEIEAVEEIGAVESIDEVNTVEDVAEIENVEETEAVEEVEEVKEVENIEETEVVEEVENIEETEVLEEVDDIEEINEAEVAKTEETVDDIDENVEDEAAFEEVTFVAPVTISDKNTGEKDTTELKITKRQGKYYAPNWAKKFFK